MSNDRATVRVLRDAASLIESRGWTQGTYESRDGRLCLFGAIHEVSHGEDYEDAWRLLGERTALDGENPIDWNDQPGRTKEEVLALLHKTAEAVR